jgi:beta-N-acetylhexosaminidase
MISSRLMIAFEGHSLPTSVAEDIRRRPVAGVSIFREANVEGAAQVRALTAEVQAASANGPLLIATDQEGGQLNACAGITTPFAGAMALGAAGSPELAERVARATAIELRALGFNVNYAPVCDLATNPRNPALGIRSFGDDPEAVAALAAATVRGLQAEGVAATAKHFPGHGDISVDTHHQLAVVDAARDEFEARELVPFRAAVEAGARLVMAGHFAIPQITGDRSLPASLSRAVMTDLLRDELRFEGLAITDALDMAALAQAGPAQIVDAIAAIRAGEDLLLGTPDAALIERIELGLAQAELRGMIDARAHEAAMTRLSTVRQWLSGFDQPSIDVVASSEHLALAHELAGRSVTLLRNEHGLVPLRLAPDSRVAVIQPRPANLTPADTSEAAAPLLAETVRRRHVATDGYIVKPSPTEADIAALAGRLADYDLIILGTAAASLLPGQAALARRVLELAKPTVTVALRTPWDLASYPSAQTYACSFGILEPSIEALVAALFGEKEFRGRLPVEINGLYSRGHGLTTFAAVQ